VIRYVYSLIVVTEEKLAVAVPGVQAIGIALGPTVIGVAIDRTGLPGGTLVAVAMTVAYLALILPLCSMSDPPLAGVTQGDCHGSI
jgi:hypothetical protein